MTLYEWIYKQLEGSGLSKNSAVVAINGMLIRNRLKKPILMKQGFSIYVDTEGPLNTSAIFLAKREYEYDETLLIKEKINGQVSVDCGSNIGYYSLLLAQQCKQVYSFEPAQHTFNILKKNIIYNKLEDKIIAKRIALSNKEQTRKLYHAKQNSGGNSLNAFPDCNASSFEEIKCKPLDVIIPCNEMISFLKIDVEGHEEEVLRGAKKTLKNTKVVMIEFNKIALKELGKSGQAILTLLKDFKISRITDQGLKPIHNLKDLDSVKHYCNLWCER